MGLGTDYQRRRCRLQPGWTATAENLTPIKKRAGRTNASCDPNSSQTILLEEDYVKAIPRRGVYIVGAWIRDPLDFYHSIIGYPLKLDRSRLDAYVDFSDVHARSVLSFQGSVFKGKLNMNGLQVGQHLFMCEGAQYQDVDLRGAPDRWTSSYDRRHESKSTLNMNGLQVGDVLFLRGGADFKKPCAINLCDHRKERTSPWKHVPFRRSSRDTGKGGFDPRASRCYMEGRRSSRTWCG